MMLITKENRNSNEERKRDWKEEKKKHEGEREEKKHQRNERK